jgi:hypothetical protein
VAQSLLNILSMGTEENCLELDRADKFVASFVLSVAVIAAISLVDFSYAPRPIRIIPSKAQVLETQESADALHPEVITILPASLAESK